MRKLPGGGKWYFVPWQKMRDKLDEIYPNWEIDYSDPVQRGEQVIVKCHLTIAGVTRVGFGNSHAEFDDWNEEKKQRGTPEERAIACAFKRAMEQFGMCRYLDIQTNKEKHTEQERAELSAFIKYMGRRSPSNRRDNQDPGALRLAMQNGWIIDKESGKPSKQVDYNQKNGSQRDDAGTRGRGDAERNVSSRPSGNAQGSESSNLRLNAVSASLHEPKPKPQAQSQPDLYPQHNTLIKKIRTVTGHDAQSIINWCKSHGAARPSQLTSERVYDLIFSMIAGWLEVAKNLSPREAADVLRGKLKHLTQNGISSLEACGVALDELQQLNRKEVAAIRN